MIFSSKYRIKIGERERKYSKKVIIELREDGQIPDDSEVFDHKRKEWINIDEFIDQFTKKKTEDLLVDAGDTSATGKSGIDLLSRSMLIFVTCGVAFLSVSEIFRPKVFASEDSQTVEAHIKATNKEISSHDTDKENNHTTVNDEHVVPTSHNTHDSHVEPNSHKNEHGSAREPHTQENLVSKLYNFEPGHKPKPSICKQILEEGNARFMAGKALHPHLSVNRIKLASQSDQGNYAYATVLACSDSRVPVEHIFDAGVMDIFSIRQAGNICTSEEIGSIEYGLLHVHTPLLVVMGHSGCGAVTATVKKVIQEESGHTDHAHPLERNIASIVSLIEPAVKKAKKEHPYVIGENILDHAIEENVWLNIYRTFHQSPAIRNLYKTGKISILGAIYDLRTGKVNFLDEKQVALLLMQAEQAKDKAIEGEEKQKDSHSTENDHH